MTTRINLYAIWYAMHDRCTNPKNPRFHRYGERGIRVCPEWETFDPFLQWADGKCGPDLQLDRENNDRDYSPDNCRFVTCAVNNQNRAFVKLTAEVVGVIKRRLIDGEDARMLASEYGVSAPLICNIRAGRKWKTIQPVLATP